MAHVTESHIEAIQRVLVAAGHDLKVTGTLDRNTVARYAEWAFARGHHTEWPQHVEQIPAGMLDEPEEVVPQVQHFEITSVPVVPVTEVKSVPSAKSNLDGQLAVGGASPKLSDVKKSKPTTGKKAKASK
jgi:hypothetical protein